MNRLAKCIYRGGHFIYGGNHSCSPTKIDLRRRSKNNRNLKSIYRGRTFKASASENGGHFGRRAYLPRLIVAEAQPKPKSGFYRACIRAAVRVSSQSLSVCPFLNRAPGPPSLPVRCSPPPPSPSPFPQLACRAAPLPLLVRCVALPLSLCDSPLPLSLPLHSRQAPLPLPLPDSR